jgi:hypothetical protein
MHGLMMSIESSRRFLFGVQTKPVSNMNWETTRVQENETSWNPADLVLKSSVAPESLGSGMTRSNKSFSAMSSCETSMSSVSSNAENRNIITDNFGKTVRIHTEGSAKCPIFDSLLRKSIEPHLKVARLLREKARKRTVHKVADSIASSMGVPYTALRHERPFLFDEHTHPLHTILAETLGVSDLSKVHEFGQDSLLEPLLDRSRRNAFHVAYDSFVTSFCIPLLHSLSIGDNTFHTFFSDKITYRYQAFPSIQIVTPGSASTGPVCDSATGHSIGCLTFHIPLTPCFGTNALYVESHPGREDWHPLHAKAVGLGYLFDGTRCMHFPLDNTTSTSRVSLNFRVLVYRGGGHGSGVDAGGLCPAELVEDRFSQSGPGYYDEALIDLNRSALSGSQMITKKYGNRLLDPDYRVGAPFDRHGGGEEANRDCGS